MKTSNELYSELGTLQTQMYAMVQVRLLRSIIRWNLTILLYYYFWHIAWVRWSLVLVLPMVIFNLTFTILCYVELRKKIRSIKTRLGLE